MLIYLAGLSGSMHFTLESCVRNWGNHLLRHFHTTRKPSHWIQLQLTRFTGCMHHAWNYFIPEGNRILMWYRFVKITYVNWFLNKWREMLGSSLVSSFDGFSILLFSPGYAFAYWLICEWWYGMFHQWSHAHVDNQMAESVFLQMVSLLKRLI